jgi:hypothetical protein
VLGLPAAAAGLLSEVDRLAILGAELRIFREFVATVPAVHT